MEHKLIVCAVALSTMLFSCVSETRDEQPVGNTGVTEISASFADSDKAKTMLGNDGQNILWSPNDEISVFYNGDGIKFTSINSIPKTNTIFRCSYSLIFGGTETSGEPYIYAAYPYSSSNAQNGDKISLTVPASQAAVEGSFGRGTFPSVGRSKTTNIAFYNVCGGIRFSLCHSGIRKITIAGNNGETIAGKVEVCFGESGLPEVSSVIDSMNAVTLTAPGDGEFQTGKWYYVSLLPVKFTDGFNLTFIRRADESESGNKSFTVSREVVRSGFGSIEDIDSCVVFRTGVAGLEFSSSNVLVAPDSSAELTLKVLPDDAKYETIEWESSDKDIATVDGDGVVTGQKDGKCTITATTDNGTTASCTVYVSKNPVTTVDAIEIGCAKAAFGGTFNVPDASSVKKSVYFLYSDTESTLEGLIANGTKVSSIVSNSFICRTKGLKAGTKYQYVAALTFSGQTVYGDVKNVTTLDLPEGAVELGLSVIWHQCNLGATKPEEYGTFFAFADVKGKTWQQDVWYGGGFSNVYTYQSDSWGKLKPEYDAAHVILGGTSRIPTRAELQELKENCTYSWTDDYDGTGVAGVVFTSKITGYTDKSIFLPASGYGRYDKWYSAGSEGDYWSCTAESSYGTTNCFCLSFGFDSEITLTTVVSISLGVRQDGLSVRPISE